MYVKEVKSQIFYGLLIQKVEKNCDEERHERLTLFGWHLVD
jgi:hypothetical protein